MRLYKSYQKQPPEVLYKKDTLKNLQENPCYSLFFNKNAGRPILWNICKRLLQRSNINEWKAVLKNT